VGSSCPWWIYLRLPLLFVELSRKYLPTDESFYIFRAAVAERKFRVQPPPRRGVGVNHSSPLTISKPVMNQHWKRWQRFQDNESVGKGLASSLLPRTNLHIPQTGRLVCFEGLHVSRVNLVSHIQCQHLSEKGVPPLIVPFAVHVI